MAVNRRVAIDLKRKGLPVPHLLQLQVVRQKVNLFVYGDAALPRKTQAFADKLSEVSQKTVRFRRLALGDITLYRV